MLADDLAQRGLRDLIDRGVDVLDRDERLHRVNHSKVCDGGDIDADVVARDDALRLDRHRDNAQRNSSNHVDDGHDTNETGLSHRDDTTEPKHDALLVLFDDPKRERQADQRQ